ncbi:hypothetical protein DMH12_24820 [Streptomyces sp. WAC 04229]|nr:hypothetical protein DMH12_24820 [Streptomyces sp. WAC 04229]
MTCLATSAAFTPDGRGSFHSPFPCHINGASCRWKTFASLFVGFAGSRRSSTVTMPATSISTSVRSTVETDTPI